MPPCSVVLLIALVIGNLQPQCPSKCFAKNQGVQDRKVTLRGESGGIPIGPVVIEEISEHGTAG